MKLPRPHRAAIIVGIAAIALATSALALTSAFAYAGDIPRGTAVLGVDIGAMSRADAETALREALAERAEELAAPITVRLGDAEAEIDPEAVGLSVDIAATVAVAASGAGGWNPIQALFGTRDVPPVVEVDPERLGEVLQPVAEQAGEAMTMPAITFDGTTPVAVYPAPGLGLDPVLAAQVLTASWPPRQPPAEGWVAPDVLPIPLVEVNPVTTAEDVDRLIEQVAQPAVAEPVTVSIPEGDEVTISPRALARSLRFTADSGGQIQPSVDAKRLRKAIEDELVGVESEPRNATVELSGGAPRTVAGAVGQRVDTEALARDLLEVLTGSGSRTVPATVITVEPEVTDDDVAALGIVERVSTFTTSFEGGLSAPRSQNIVRVAQMVDGALVMPGEVFSLNEHTGERSYAQGFQDAAVIIDGRLQPGVGGGISQFTTTLFNAAYYAGLEDVEHQPHTIHYTRYPSVIEATIFYPHLDLKFRNDTAYGVLIDTSYTDDSVTVTLWSTKVWDEVTTEWSPKRDTTRPQRRYVTPGPSCIETQGIDGFTQDAWRVFHRDGGEVKREKFTWRYDPQPEVVCGEEPDDD